ncbi:MAG: hypothetical protein GWN73_22535, partial [Actinobacteria bacterium]|nr:hypothetical protein [Actinomycetota bacterium]NIU68039.1 hypothetical protein [Actinomycetota bacterium]NIW29828.1 hypothetical protein [Actinomycetota bacterium]
MVTEPPALIPEAPPPVIVNPSIEELLLAIDTTAARLLIGWVSSQTPVPVMIVVWLFCEVIQSSA